MNSLVEDEKKETESSYSQIIRGLLFVLGTYLMILVSIILVIGIGGGIIYIIISLCSEVDDYGNVLRVRIPTGIILAVAVGTLYGVISILKGLFYSFSYKKIKSFEIGLQMNIFEHPKLNSFINDLCKNMKTNVPKNIILHCEPTFFVTQGNLQLLNKVISGRTLAIGLPLLSYLSVNELRAILSHEFAHFTGKDTTYTTIVYPIYMSTITSITNLQSYIDSYSYVERGWIYTIPLLIPNLLLRTYYNWFNSSNKKLSRLREHRADIIAENFCGGKTFKNGLLKVYGISKVFTNYSLKHIYNSYIQGKVYVNYYSYFRSIYDEVYTEAENRLSIELNRKTDVLSTHPALSDRLEYITSDDERYMDNESAINLIEDFNKLEEEMTELYSEYLVCLNKWR